MRPIMLCLLILTGACAGPTVQRDRIAAAVPESPWGRPGSAARGAVLAQTRCSSCHAIGRFDRSAVASAPPFRGLAQRYPVANLQEAFAEGLVTAHPTMPQFQFEEDDIADLIAYLDSVGDADTRQTP